MATKKGYRKHLHGFSEAGSQISLNLGSALETCVEVGEFGLLLCDAALPVGGKDGHVRSVRLLPNTQPPKAQMVQRLDEAPARRGLTYFSCTPRESSSTAAGCPDSFAPVGCWWW